MPVNCRKESPWRDSTTTSPEDAALQDGSMAHGAADTEPHAPGVGGRGTDADGERPHHRAAGQEEGSAIDADGILLVEAVVHRTAHHAYAGVQREVLERQDILHVPQVAGADVPVA